MLKSLILEGINDGLFLEITVNGITLFGKPVPALMFAPYNMIELKVEAPWAEGDVLTIHLGPEPYCKIVV